MLATYFIFPPIGQFAIADGSDAVSLVFFFVMGVCVSLVLEHYRQSQVNLAAYKRQEALRESSERLRQITEYRQLALDAAQLGAWEYRFDSDEVYWDAQCRQMFGVGEGERIDYEACIAIIHPEERDRIDQIMKRAVSGVDVGAYDEEFRVVWPDGSIHWVSSHGRALPGGEGEKCRPARFAGVNLDITNRKHAEQALRDQAALLHEVGAIAHIGGWEFNVSTGQGSWTEEVARIHDLDPDSPIGMEVGSELLPPDIEAVDRKGGSRCGGTG